MNEEPVEHAKKAVKATEHDTHSIEDSLKKIRKITPRKRAGQRVKAAPAKRLNEPLMCNSFHQNYFYQKGMQPMRVQKVAEKLPGITAMANATTLLDRLGDREPHMQAYMAAPCPAPNSLHSSNDKLSRQEIIELGQLLPGCNPVVDSPSVVLSKARSHIRCLTEELMLLRQCKAKQPAAQK